MAGMKQWDLWVMIVALLALLVATDGYRLNLSDSMPRGFYRLTAVAPPLARGSLVVLEVPASVHALFPWWWRPLLLKPVAAVAGDVVCVRDDELTIGDTSYGPVYTSADGQVLPRPIQGCHLVPEGQVFVASPTPGSLDSRYFSWVGLGDLHASAQPVWTWR